MICSTSVLSASIPQRVRAKAKVRASMASPMIKGQGLELLDGRVLVYGLGR